MKTIIGINNLVAVDQYVYANHLQFFYRLGKTYPNDFFALCNPRRMSIDRMRNFCAKAALENEFDYVLFIDDDVLVPFDCIGKLIEADKDICAGVTLIRGYPFKPMIFDFKKEIASGKRRDHYMDDYAERADKNGLVECDAVGFSLCLIKVSLLRKMQPPFFITGPHHTEDVYFCMQAKAQVPDVSIFAHTFVHTAHNLGSDFIEPRNAAARRIFEETIEPAVLAMNEPERRDRAQAYYNQFNLPQEPQENEGEKV